MTSQRKFSGALGALWATLFALLISTCVIAAPTVDRRQDEDAHWVGSWTSMPQLVEPHNNPPSPFGGQGTTFRDASLRQTLFMSLTAETIRFQVSNTFGGAPLPVTGMTVAYPTGDQAGVAGIETDSIVKITFDGQDSVTVPQGEVIYSDPVEFSITAQTNIAVTMYFAEGQASNNICGHPGSRTTSWMSNGNQLEAATISGQSTKHWYFLTIVEALMPTDTGSIIVLGDSITDGRGSEDDHNNRWPDLLATRMQAEGITNLGMNNQAAGGNAVLQGGLGPTLLTRYNRDLLEQQNVKYMILFIGVNDIGNAGGDVSQGLINAFGQVADAAKAAGIITIGATIAPFNGPGQGYYTPQREQMRTTVNNWIMTSGTFDHTVDFAAILGDPNSPDKLAAAYDGGDHLHPNVAGYQAVADNFPLEIFTAG